MSRTRIVINAKAGTAMQFAAETLERRLSGVFGPEASVSVVEPDRLRRDLESAFADKAVDTVVVGGGDGSVSLAGRLGFEAGKTLGVIPLGTMNLFARALGMPLDLENAARTISQGRSGKVDIGTVDGEPFLNHVGIGLQPRMIRLRETMPQSGRISKIINGLRAFLRVSRKPKPAHLRISGSFEAVDLKAVLALVTVNPIPRETGFLPVTPGQSAGELGLYLGSAETVMDVAALAAAVSVEGWEGAQNLIHRTSQTVTIDCDHTLQVSIDGEIGTRSPPLNCEIRRQALSVILPSGPDGASVQGQDPSAP